MRVRLLIAGVVVTGASLVPGVATASATTSPVPLTVPQSTAFAVLGYSCGSIGERAYADGFDATTGYPTGDTYLTTTCSAGGRGGHSVTYSAWISTEWDFTGALVSYAVLTTAPSVDPSFSATDLNGNTVYNANNSAFLTLAPDFVPAPRVAGVSPGSAPQGSSVTITGTGFTGATVVSFGTSAAASYSVTSPTSITAVAPAVKTGTVDVTVSGPGGTSLTNPSDQFTFLPSPLVEGVSPDKGSTDGGTKVTITGANFAGTTEVAFGGVPARIKKVGKRSIVAISPPGSDSGITVDVTVTNKHGTSAITTADHFTYVG